MPVITRRRSTLIVVAAAVAVTLLLAVGAALISVLVGQSCVGGFRVSYVTVDSIKQLFRRRPEK